MVGRDARLASIRLLVVVALLALPIAMAGCSQSGDTGSKGQDGPPSAEKPAAEEKSAPPEYTSWVVYINDEDSYSTGGMTYEIALNFTATNPTSDIAGTYKGKATASTSTQGSVGKGQLNAQAIAQSGNLQFTIKDPHAPLAQLDPETWQYSGAGTITMKAAGTASVGAASGGYSNTSSQNIDIQVNGSKVTLSVVIQGHKYTFDGTISGK